MKFDEATHAFGKVAQGLKVCFGILRVLHKLDTKKNQDLPQQWEKQSARLPFQSGSKEL